MQVVEVTDEAFEVGALRRFPSVPKVPSRSIGGDASNLHPVVDQIARSESRSGSSGQEAEQQLPSSYQPQPYDVNGRELDRSVQLRSSGP